MALAALALDRCSLFANASGLELGNEPGLFIFGERSCDLAHHLARRIATVGQVVAAGRENADSPLDQRQDPQLLRHKFSGEPRCVFDNDGPNTVALNPIQQGGEAGTSLNRVRAANCGIVELIDQDEPCPLGVALDSSPLSLVAVLVGADICGR